MARVLSPTAAELLDRFAVAARRRFGGRVAEVVLFGSHARGEAHEESDVDVLVVVDGLTDLERRELVDMAYDVGTSVEDSGGLSVLARSTGEARELRASGRRLWREIDADGVRA